MDFTFENVDFVIRRTLKCCIDVFWNLRPEAFDEMLFYYVAQGGTAPDKAAIKKHRQLRYRACEVRLTLQKPFCLSLPALEEHDLSSEHGDSIQDHLRITSVWGGGWCGLRFIGVDVRVWACSSQTSAVSKMRSF